MVKKVSEKKIRESIDKNKFNKIISVGDRAVDMGLYDWSNNPRFTANMDIELASDYYDINLDDLLNSRDSDFVHDITGIQKAINRQRKDFSNDEYFLPRFANTTRRTTERKVRETVDRDGFIHMPKELSKVQKDLEDLRVSVNNLCNFNDDSWYNTYAVNEQIKTIKYYANKLQNSYSKLM